MKYLRAIGIGVLFWLIIFIEISITMIGLKFSNTLVYIIHYIVMIPLGIFIAWLYYKSKDKINGFLLGLFIVITGIVLDLMITVPLFIIPSGGTYISYFSEIFLIIGFIEAVIIIGIYDFFKKRIN
jgi:hypothetical protein